MLRVYFYMNNFNKCVLQKHRWPTLNPVLEGILCDTDGGLKLLLTLHVLKLWTQSHIQSVNSLRLQINLISDPVFNVELVQPWCFDHSCTISALRRIFLWAASWWPLFLWGSKTLSSRSHFFRLFLELKFICVARIHFYPNMSSGGLILDLTAACQTCWGARSQRQSDCFTADQKQEETGSHKHADWSNTSVIQSSPNCQKSEPGDIREKINDLFCQPIYQYINQSIHTVGQFTEQWYSRS